MALPEQLNFVGVKGHFASVPRLFGNVAQYVGRKLDYDAINKNSRKRTGGFIDTVVLENPEECYPLDPTANATFNRALGVAVMQELRKMALQGEIAPADSITAAWCGVKQAEGVSVPADGVPRTFELEASETVRAAHEASTPEPSVAPAGDIGSPSPPPEVADVAAQVAEQHASKETPKRKREAK